MLKASQALADTLGSFSARPAQDSQTDSTQQPAGAAGMKAVYMNFFHMDLGNCLSMEMSGPSSANETAAQSKAVCDELISAQSKIQGWFQGYAAATSDGDRSTSQGIRNRLDAQAPDALENTTANGAPGTRSPDDPLDY